MTQLKGGRKLPKKRPIKERIKAFLEAYAETCSVAHAAKFAGVKRREHYRWLERYPKYAAVFRETQRLAAEYLEGELVTRATKGWLEPVFYQGKQCGTVRRFDGSTGMALLRGMWPEKYGSKVQISAPHVAAPAQPPRLEVVYVSAEEDAARKKPPVRSEALPGTQGFQNVQHQGSGTAGGVLRPEAADAVSDPQTVLFGNSIRNTEPAPTGRSVPGRVPPQSLPLPAEPNLWRPGSQEPPKSDEEIIALARRFLKSADAAVAD
jgi:hypothetical protein